MGDRIGINVGETYIDEFGELRVRRTARPPARAGFVSSLYPPPGQGPRHPESSRFRLLHCEGTLQSAPNGVVARLLDLEEQCEDDGRLFAEGVDDLGPVPCDDTVQLAYQQRVSDDAAKKAAARAAKRKRTLGPQRILFEEE